MKILPEDITRFYGASALALRALDGASGLRFGTNADARWRLFRGELDEADRLDLLVRDAAVQYPAAFAARVVFDLDGLADDEPFGPEWPGIDAPSAATILREAAAGPAVQLERLAASWGLSPREFPNARLQGITPSTRLAVAGAGATLALARLMAGKRDFDLGDQATFIGDSPAPRHLFGLAVALLGGTTPAKVFNSKAERSKRVDVVLVSNDATEAETRAAEGGLK